MLQICDRKELTKDGEKSVFCRVFALADLFHF